ncbi:hemolysin-type calcium binding protein related domain protein [compost metagenome]
MENANDMRLKGAASPLCADVAASGLAASDIVTSRRGDDLLLQVRGSAETVTIHDYFRKNAAGGYVADEVRFADGRLWQLRPGAAAAPVL